MWWTGLSRSAVRCPPGSGSHPRPSVRIGGCPSPIGTARGSPVSEDTAMWRPSPHSGGAEPGDSGGSGGRPLALPLGVTAGLVGGYRWIEHALYEVLGSWVTDIPLAAVQVHLDVQSTRHAWHAELWADRLPVLNGVDPDSLTKPPDPAGTVLTTLTGSAPLLGTPVTAGGGGGGPRPPGAPPPPGRPLPGGHATSGRELRAPSAIGLAGDRRPADKGVTS